MKVFTNTKYLVGILLVVFAFSSIDALGQRRKPKIRRANKTSRAKQSNYKVATGTKIRVRMEREINSKVSQPGDRFETKVTEPVYASNGVIVIPNGSAVIGEIDSVTQAKKGGDPGTISVSFIEVRLPNGERRTINGSLTSLDSKTAKSDNEGTASRDKMKNRKIIFIGGGTAGGAILGGVIGGGKGAVIGGIIGAVGGLIGERSTKGKDARVKEGTEFGVYINREFYLPRYSANDPVIEFPESNDREVVSETAGTNTGSRTYVVQRGDTLGIISRKVYGTSSRYMDIYNANRDKLSSPNNVSVGQVLVIP
ncbi:MAG: LysM peptidoglycan-binding domain-containing protein [Pyrinomonadaceae bacterium]|nr:LysM peptidoglycan-binding domain-containing protein [Pyrinomonadaceae bacterium]